MGSNLATLAATGAIGPDYILLVSTNLVNWQPFATNIAVAMPLQFTDTNASDGARFYRLQLGP